MKIPKVGDKVIRTGKSVASVKEGECHAIKSVQQSIGGRTWIRVGRLLTRSDVFWDYFKPAQVKLENK